LGQRAQLLYTGGVRTLSVLTVLLLVAAPALADPSPEGRYKLEVSHVTYGPYAPSPLRARAVLRVDGDVLRFDSRLVGAFAGDARPTGDRWTLRPTTADTIGVTGHLRGAQPADAPTVELQLRRSTRAEGVLIGRVLRDGRPTAHLRLTQAPRALLVYTSLRAWHERVKILYRVVEAENEYRRRGYSLTRLKATSVSELTQRLQRAAAANDPFDRIVILSHAGPRDGPIYGYDHDETQTSPHLNQQLWGPFTQALRAGTSADALIYVGGCHTGGWDSDERDTGRGPRPDECSWVEKASRASERTVIGPAGLTSWWKTHDAILALEGDQGAPQETRWAYPDRAVIVADRESKADAFEDVPELTASPAAAARGETITIRAKGFALTRGQQRLQVLVVFGSRTKYAWTSSALPDSTIVEVEVPEQLDPGPTQLDLRIGGESVRTPFEVR